MDRYAMDPGTAVLLHDLGVPAANVLRRAGLPGDLLARGPVTLPAAEYFAFWQALDDEAGGPAVAVRIGRALTAEVFLPALFAALCSPCLRVAAQRVATYKGLIGPMRLLVGDDTVTYRFPPGHRPPPALVLTELVFWTVLARIGTRHDVRPVRVDSPWTPPDQGPFREFLGVPVSFGPVPSVTFTAYDMDRSFLTANDAMWRFFEPELRRRLAALDRHASTAERVRAALLHLLPAGQGTMSVVARSLSVSTRTLQRRLRDEDTSFQAVLTATRTRLARHYLATGELSADQISFLLGYGDPKSFYRAFRTWTGVTPTHARAVHIRSSS
ncbi:helix-turn-helix domain-containing protein [Actinoplanes sp. TBRC 11911]|uniref:AraC family transcriptional regulator n=1 Tax=Actinoplanes sp. TBRC 11911 TaxID=2729386 RepID=UPI00145FA310|nr:AraC family transcriptional regulator [Actinoplanes sp. TBRC 11911]NMO57835.1 helix-turn-helix domain-containing protein [Actinoplanes sp. TBRC 11911]